MKKYIGRRITATLLDYSVCLVLSLVYILIFGEPTDEGGTGVQGATALPLFAYWFVYFVVLEYLISATPGHVVVDLKVVRLDGGKIDFVHALKRRLCDPFDLSLFGIPAIIAIKNTEHGQRLGDIWAHTCVIHASQERPSAM